MATSSMTHVLVRTPGVGDSTKSMTWVLIWQASRALVGYLPARPLHPQALGVPSCGCSWSVKLTRPMLSQCGEQLVLCTVLPRGPGLALRALDGSIRWTKSNTSPL